MVGNQEVAVQLQETLAAAERCTSEETGQNYDALAQDLAELEKAAKAACAAHADSRALVAKLRAGTALSAEDLATLRLLMVGDADYYLKYDEEFDRCKTEVAKITAEMRQLQADELTADALMHLSVMSLEARILLELTRHYLEARDRVQRFNTATSVAIDQDSANTLIRIIEGMTA
jgi:hypothetical protein